MLIVIWLFIIGTLFWSFGSVILQRMQRKINWKVLKWFFFWRSECPKCHHQLHRYNLIPLVSRFRQGGRCMYCKAPISSLYPVVEIVSGLVFSLRWWIYLLPYLDGLGELSWMMLVFWWLLGLLLVWDIYTYELHVPVWFSMLVMMLLYSVVLLSQGEASWYLLTASAGFLGLFLAIYWFGKWYAKARFWQAVEAFWQGDVMLAPMLGFLFAVSAIGQANFISLLLIFILGSCVVGLVYYGVVMLVIKLRKKKTNNHIHESGAPMIPFLPSMILAYWGIVVYSLLWLL